MSVDKAIAKHKALQAAAKNISIEDVQNAWGSEWDISIKGSDIILIFEDAGEYYEIDEFYIERGDLSCRGRAVSRLYVIPVSQLDDINIARDYLLQELSK